MALETSDLTSLSWLHNLNIMDNLSSMSGTAPPTPPASPLPDHLLGMMGCMTASSYSSSSRAASLTSSTSHPGRDNNNSGQRYGSSGNNKRPSSSTSSTSSTSSSSSVSSAVVKEEEIDYKTVGDVKPPYSYASLICMAMKSNKHKMTLSSIYKWIKENFLYYRNADPSWQVTQLTSIRYNFGWLHLLIWGSCWTQSLQSVTIRDLRSKGQMTSVSPLDWTSPFSSQVSPLANS